MPQNNLLTMEDLLSMNLQETGSQLKATFRKIVNNAPYETETLELSAELNMERSLTLGEKAFAVTALEHVLEYTVWAELYLKQRISTEEFDQQKKLLEDSINVFKAKVADNGGLTVGVELPADKA